MRPSKKISLYGQQSLLPSGILFPFMPKQALYYCSYMYTTNSGSAVAAQCKRTFEIP